MATGNAVTIRRSVTSATRIATASRTTRTMVVVRVPGPSATAVDVTSGSIGAARRAATVRWSGVDHDRALTGSTDARPDGRVSPAARAARDGAVLAGLLFLAYLFLVIAPAAAARSASMPSRTGTSTRPRRTRAASGRSAPSTTRRRSRGSSTRSGCSSGRRSCGSGWRSSWATWSGSAVAACGCSGSWRCRRSPSSSITATSTCGSPRRSCSASATRGRGPSCC